MSEEFFEHYNPVRIVYGSHIVGRIGEYIVRYVGGNLALILLDTKTFLGCRGLLGELVDSLKKNGLEYVVYDKIPVNPTIAELEEAVNVYRESYADIIIGFGDQNSIGSAKILAAAIALGGRLEKLKTDYHRVKAAVPVVAIPSSHGVGYEFTSHALVADSNGVDFIRSQALYPKLTVLDPYVALKAPLNIAVLGVVYALANALSVLVGVGYNPLSSLYATASIETILSNYKLMLDKPDNIAVHGRLLQASMLAGMALDTSGPSLLHVIAHTIPLIYRDVYPGRIIAAILPSWLKHVAPRAGNKALIARVLGVPIEKSADKVKEVLEDMKAYTRLSDIGVEENDITEILKLIDENLRGDVKKVLEDSL